MTCFLVTAAAMLVMYYATGVARIFTAFTGVVKAGNDEKERSADMNLCHFALPLYCCLIF